MALTLDIVTPERRVLSTTCDEVRAPGIQGGFGIRRDHVAFMTALEPGRLTFVEGGREHHYAIGGGFLQVADNKIIVLADTGEARDEIDVAAAEQEFRDATEQDEGYRIESARVRRAAARLTVAR
jgi:F-type H+-transporting ATPase subunit epsilon